MMDAKPQNQPDVAPRVVLLHGFMGSPEDWAHVQGALPFATHAIALPGHGPNAAVAATLDDAADHIAAHLSASSIVIGYSLGGRMALRLADRYPERIERVMLISAHPGLTDDAERRKRRAIDAQRGEQIRTDFAGFLARWYAAPLFGFNADERARVIAKRLRHDPTMMATLIEAVSPGIAPESWHVVAELARTKRLHVVVGAEDTKYRTLWSNALAQHPGLALTTLAGRHALLETHPTRVAEAIGEWVGQAHDNAE